MNNHQLIYKKIFGLIEKADHILLISHKRPDGDALGSISAFIHYFDKIKKSYTAFCPNQPSFYFLHYLSEIEKIISEKVDIDKTSFDLVIILDSSDLDYIGVPKLFDSLAGRPTVVNIDHHHTNEHFGDVNLVEPGSSSTTEIIYNLFEANSLQIDKEIATSLLTGILTDTGNFTNPGTTVSSLRVASELLRRGARFPKIITYTYKNKTISTLKLWGRVLGRLELNKKFGIATTVITLEDIQQFQADLEVTEGIANFLNNLTGVKAILVLKEEEGGKIKGSLRAIHTKVDVSRLARILGGGGHKKAAGFTIEGRLLREGDRWIIK